MDETKVKHTPTDWVIRKQPGSDPVSYGVETRDGNEVIASWITKTNARLIAAAPELLEALKSIEAWLNERSSDVYFPIQLRQQAIVAISKAKGTND